MHQLYTSIITIGVMWFAIVLSPGPNFLLTANTSLNHSNRMGVIVASGIAVGTVTWALLSMLGISLLFYHFHFLREFIVIAGAFYLLYLGATFLRKKKTIYDRDNDSMSHSKHYFLRGYLVDLSNPKAALFFTSLFSIAMPQHSPLWFKIVLLIEIGLVAFFWYAFVAWIMRREKIQTLLINKQSMIQYIVGIFFITLAVYFVFEAFH